MPEFPEVESLRRHLATRGLAGKTITDVIVSRPATIRTPDPASFVQGIRGRKFTALERRGKYLLFRLDGPTLLDRPTLIVHLRMTGRLELVYPAEITDRAPKVTFLLDSGQELRFSDWRNFGRVWLVDDSSEVVGKLGPEPLEQDFTREYVRASLQRSRQVKPLLLDQDLFAGIGNIYADEALWCAGISPVHLARDLTSREANRLHACIIEVLSGAAERLERNLNEGGQWVTENGRGPRIAEGGDDAEPHFKVPRKKGMPCRRCGKPIEAIRLGGRGTYYCPHCQV